MKIKMMKIGDCDGYLVMKVIQSWNLSSDESYIIYIIVKKLWRFACGDVLKELDINGNGKQNAVNQGLNLTK